MCHQYRHLHPGKPIHIHPLPSHCLCVHFTQHTRTYVFFGSFLLDSTHTRTVVRAFLACPSIPTVMGTSKQRSSRSERPRSRLHLSIYLLCSTLAHLLVLLFNELQGRHGLTVWPVVLREALLQALLIRTKIDPGKGTFVFIRFIQRSFYPTYISVLQKRRPNTWLRW